MHVNCGAGTSENSTAGTGRRSINTLRHAPVCCPTPFVLPIQHLLYTSAPLGQTNSSSPANIASHITMLI
jgi:prephenate dehydratase